MSKNTRNTAFRKVDVDQFEEEKYEEEVVSDEGVTGPNDAEVQSLLSKYPFLTDKQRCVLHSAVKTMSRTGSI